jgi:hypothetical protein
VKRTKRCNECGATDIRTATTTAGGGHAPDFLPGAHPWWRSGRLEIYVCCACGYFQFFVPEDELQEVRESEKFEALR